MNKLAKINLMFFCLIITGCKTIQNPYVTSGNTITYQHSSDIESINKARTDANSQCLVLGYKNAIVSHTSCSAGDCITKFTCE